MLPEDLWRPDTLLAFIVSAVIYRTQCRSCASHWCALRFSCSFVILFLLLKHILIG